MKRYFWIRALSAVPTLLLLTLVLFALLQLLPGGPAEAALARFSRFSSQEISQQTKAQIRATYGFDKPLTTRYFTWLSHLAKGDLGRSYYSGESVCSVLFRAFKVSFVLCGLAILFTQALAILLGRTLAQRSKGVTAWIGNSGPAFFFALPSFVLASGLIYFAANNFLGLNLPLSGLTSDGFSLFSFWGKCHDLFRHLLLPVFCLVAASIAPTLAVSRRAFYEELIAPYLTAARAKGISERRAFWFHAFRNACVPISAHFSQYYLTNFFAGTLVIEVVFNLQGMGHLGYESLLHRDYPVVCALVLFIGAFNIAANFFQDILLRWLDPRVEFG